MSRSIVFDFDGTLITCENKQKFVLFSIIKDYGHNVEEIIDNWWNLKRGGLNTREALIESGLINADIISREWANRIENFIWCYLDKPFPDSVPVLSYLRNCLLRIIILTARKSAIQVYQAVSRFGFDNFTDDIIVVDPTESVKMKKRQLKMIRPVMFVGDTESDYFASVGLDMKFVALSRGQRNPEFLRSQGVKNIKRDLQFLTSFSF